MDLKESMDKFRQLMEADDRGDDIDDLPEELFGRCYVTHDYSKGDRAVATVSFGGKVFDSVEPFYRLLFLARPGPISFSDMYKSGDMFAVCSPDGRFCAHFLFWKYQPALDFSAAKEFVQGGMSVVIAGCPDSNNGITANDPLLTEWCELLVVALERKWTVYSGNDFVV